MRGIVPFAPVANRYCQQRGGSGPLWVGPTPRPPLTNLIDNLRSARNDHPMTVQPLFCDPFTPTGKLKPSYNSARSGLQGNAIPPTGKDAHPGRPLSPVSRKKSRVSRPRSSGKSFHFPRRTFSRSPTGCPRRRFAASATPVFCDRRPFLCRRADFLCRRSTFLCRRRPHALCPQGIHPFAPQHLSSLLPDRKVPSA